MAWPRPLPNFLKAVPPKSSTITRPITTSSGRPIPKAIASHLSLVYLVDEGHRGFDDLFVAEDYTVPRGAVNNPVALLNVRARAALEQAIELAIVDHPD